MRSKSGKREALAFELNSLNCKGSKVTKRRKALAFELNSLNCKGSKVTKMREALAFELNTEKLRKYLAYYERIT